MKPFCGDNQVNFFAIRRNGEQNITTSNDACKSVIFAKGEKATNDRFTGAVWLDVLVPKDSTFNCPIGNVTFEPGARTHWHKHPGGQLLLVTGGKGYSQEEGTPMQVIQEGDVEKVSPDVKHWSVRHRIVG